MYHAMAARRPVPLPVSEANRIISIRDWDNRIVAPRHGFRDAEHYYREANVAQHLHRIETRTLMVVAQHDPMVPYRTLLPHLDRASPATTLKLLSCGGHVGFPKSTDLGQRGALGLLPQVLAWFRTAS